MIDSYPGFDGTKVEDGHELGAERKQRMAYFFENGENIKVIRETLI